MKPAIRICQFALLYAAAGCTTSASNDPYAPEEMVTGIYKVTATTLQDTCDPPRFHGSGVVSAFHDATGISAYDYSPAITMQYTMSESLGYSHEVPGGNARFDPCPDTPSDSSVVRTFTLTSADREHFEVEATQTWTLTAPCGSSSIGIVGASVVPTASCHATRTLRYDLTEACAAPCVIKYDTTTTRQPQPACVCGS